MPAELWKLRYFVVVAEEGNVGRAAERLYMAQPPLSRAIQALEAELGAQLFVRSSRGMTLTPAGEDFLAQARSLLTDADRALRRVQRAARGDDRLSVGFVGTAGHRLLAAALRGFARAHPDIALELHAGRSLQDTSGGVRDEAVDLAFVRAPLDRRGLVIQELYREPCVAMLHAGHPLAGRASIGIGELADDPWVQVRFDDAVAADFWLGRSLLGPASPPTAGPEATTLDEVWELVRAGLGVALCPATAERRAADGDVALVALDERPTTACALAWSETVRATEPLAQFVALTRELAARRSPRPPAG